MTQHTHQQQLGATLVELLVAISIFIVLALASATLYSTSLKLFVKNKVSEDLQREGDAVLAHMSQNLKEATEFDAANSNLISNPNVLQIKLSTGQTRRYYVTSNQLHYVSEAGADSLLLAPNTTVTSLTFTPVSNTANNLVSVRVQSTLSRTKANKTVTLNIGSSITTRPQ